MKRLLPALLLVLAGPARAAFQKETGTTAAEFLRVGAGARALGMADAFGPVAEGAEAAYWNPAGLARLSRPEFTYSRSEFLRFFHHDFAAYAHPGVFHGTLGAAVTRFSQDSLPVVTNSNVTLGEFNPHSEAVAVAYAREIEFRSATAEARDYFRESWHLAGGYRPLEQEREVWTGSLLVGGAFKVVHETLYQRNATAVAVDGGAIWRPEDLPRLSLSAAVRNLGTTERFINDSASLPLEIDLGAAYDKRWRDSRLLPVLELAFPYYASPYAKIGLEYSKPAAKDVRVSVRAGYKSQTVADLGVLSGFAFGVGTRYKSLLADFGFQPMAALGEVYRLSVGWSW